MPKFICDAVVTSSVTCHVEAKDLEEAKLKFRKGEWDDYDEDGGEVQKVDCDISTVVEES